MNCDNLLIEVINGQVRAFVDGKEIKWLKGIEFKSEAGRAPEVVFTVALINTKEREET